MQTQLLLDWLSDELCSDLSQPEWADEDTLTFSLAFDNSCRSFTAPEWLHIGAIDFKRGKVLCDVRVSELPLNKMETKVLNLLNANQSKQKSTFAENAKWRKENATWLQWSRAIALTLVDYMQENDISKSELAGRLGVSHQYVSKLLSGQENLSLKSLTAINEKLDINCLESVFAES